MKKLKHSSEEYKRQCVASYRCRGKRTLAEVAADFDIAPSTLSNWNKHFELENATVQSSGESEVQRILRLEKLVLQQKNEIDFLKKISVYFAQESPAVCKKP